MRAEADGCSSSSAENPDLDEAVRLRLRSGILLAAP
jgi:hypothetical protein